MSENIKKGRPIGSKNRPKVNSKGGVKVLNFEKQVENAAITKKSGFGFRRWGVNNDYPTLLLNLYNQSPTHSAAINFGVQSIIGEGIDYEKSKFDGGVITPNYYQNWEEILRSISLDYMLYGSYAIEVILNRDKKTYSFFHVPLDKIRWSDFDSDGQITSYWICKDWTQPSLNPPIEVDAFDMRDDQVIKYGKPYLYVYRPYSPTQDYYTTPHYAPAIQAIQAEIEAINFDLKTTVNNFVPAGMITLNQVETDEERDALIRNITSMFTSTNNANSVMISFKSNIEEQAPTFTPFTANQGNVNLYDSLSERAIMRILAAHQINSPSLIGLPIGSSGFNSEGALLDTAYNVYQKVVGNHNRQCVVKTFNFMLKMQGIDTELVLKPLVFGSVTDNVSVSTDTTSDENIDSNDYKENNVEEKVTE